MRAAALLALTGLGSALAFGQASPLELVFAFEGRPEKDVSRELQAATDETTLLKVAEEHGYEVAPLGGAGYLIIDPGASPLAEALAEVETIRAVGVGPDSGTDVSTLSSDVQQSIVRALGRPVPRTTIRAGGKVFGAPTLMWHYALPDGSIVRLGYDLQGATSESIMAAAGANPLADVSLPSSPEEAAAAMPPNRFEKSVMFTFSVWSSINPDRLAVLLEEAGKAYAARLREVSQAREAALADWFNTAFSRPGKPFDLRSFLDSPRSMPDEALDWLAKQLSTSFTSEADPHAAAKAFLLRNDPVGAYAGVYLVAAFRGVPPASDFIGFGPASYAIKVGTVDGGGARTP